MFWTRCGLAFVAVVLAAGIAQAATPRVTHKQVQAIKVAKTNGVSLQSIARTSDGRLVALVGSARFEGVRGSGQNSPTTEIRVYDDHGDVLTTWSVDFLGQAIGAGPNGSLFVGGDGKIAQYDAQGKLLKKAELPHLAALMNDKESLRKEAEATIESQRQSVERTKKAYQKQIELLKGRIEKLEAADELTSAEQRRLKRYRQQLAQYEGIDFREQDQALDVERVVRELIQRAAMISGVSANDTNIFVVCGEQKGHGFAVWRMDYDFSNPTKVLAGLKGCCGQMDVQARGNELFVAENTKHAVGRYDVEGNSIQEFGRKVTKKNLDGFGSCCNPMNVCFGPEGQILTAESEGIIRRFSATGEPLGLVGHVPLTGGCKNVALAASNDGAKIYFCDLPNSRIIVLAPVADEAEAESIAKAVQKEAEKTARAEVEAEAAEESGESAVGAGEGEQE